MAWYTGLLEDCTGVSFCLGRERFKIRYTTRSHFVNTSWGQQATWRCICIPAKTKGESRVNYILLNFEEKPSALKPVSFSSKFWSCEVAVIQGHIRILLYPSRFHWNLFGFPSRYSHVYLSYLHLLAATGAPASVGFCLCYFGQAAQIFYLNIDYCVDGLLKRSRKQIFQTFSSWRTQHATLFLKGFSIACNVVLRSQQVQRTSSTSTW